jgi:23S rRNA (adenine2503-C2)-methyltransferase
MIEEFIKENNLPSYRLKQFNQAFYVDLISSFNQISTWPKELREKLKKTLTFSSLTPVKQISSQNQDTIKVLFSRIKDKKCFESVLMKHKDGRNTVCVSCMIGCPVGCVFCATGKMGLIANLSHMEIIDQILYFARILKSEKKTVSNIVFMGMGEPLINLEQVLKTIKIITDPEKLGMSMRRITISTSGIVNNLKKLIASGFKGRLALSLHAPDQELREQLIPIAEKFPLQELISIFSGYADKTNKRVSYEYILIDGINDQPEHAKALAGLIGTRLTHVNLIPLNPIENVPLDRSSKEAIHKFSLELNKYGIHHTIRVTMGDDIKAACGQLKTDK